MHQVKTSWQNADPGLIWAAETFDNDIDSGEIADLEANTSEEDESSFFNDSSPTMKHLKRSHGQKSTIRLNFCIVIRFSDLIKEYT